MGHQTAVVLLSLRGLRKAKLEPVESVVVVDATEVTPAALEMASWWGADGSALRSEPAPHRESDLYQSRSRRFVVDVPLAGASASQLRSVREAFDRFIADVEKLEGHGGGGLQVHRCSKVEVISEGAVEVAVSRRFNSAFNLRFNLRFNIVPQEKSPLPTPGRGPSWAFARTPTPRSQRLCLMWSVGSEFWLRRWPRFQSGRGGGNSMKWQNRRGGDGA